ncbi:MAG: GntR family transcriptional regulator [Devosia sp.]
MSVTQLPRPRKLETVGNQVLEHIRDAILSGRLIAGTRIDQNALAAELGVSIIPVRESLRQLEAEGLIEKRPYRGAFVAAPSMTELMDIYVTREALEELATRLAVALMTSETLDSLQGLIHEMESATAASDRVALFDLNATFHFTLYTASKNAILCQLIESLWDRSTVYRRRFTFMPERAAQALAEHQEILAACRRGDAEAAGRAVRKNVAQTTKAIADDHDRPSPETSE